MGRLPLLAALTCVAPIVSPVAAQVPWDVAPTPWDFGGRAARGGRLSLELGSGAIATRRRLGNVEVYRSSNGTTGISWYGSTGRVDSYSNRKRGWSAGAYVPYRDAASVYRRRYGVQPLFAPRIEVYPWVGVSPAARRAAPVGP